MSSGMETESFAFAAASFLKLDSTLVGDAFFAAMVSTSRSITLRQGLGSVKASLKSLDALLAVREHGLALQAHSPQLQGAWHHPGDRRPRCGR
jgi:hypothetical protein